MTNDTREKLNKMFTDSAIMRAAETPTDVEIDTAATELGVMFDEDYREFLQNYGGAMVGPFPVFGLRPVELMDPQWSVVAVTERYRSEDVAELANWYIVSEDHAGNPIGVDADGRVWIFDHDFGGATQLANTFEDFLRTHCLRIDRIS